MSLSELQLPEAVGDFYDYSFLFDPFREVRETVTKRLNEPITSLDKAHDRIESTERSPYLTDFEDFYRKKLALGKLTLAEVFLKIDLAVRDRGITLEEAAHMKEHLSRQPPTIQEIQAAVEEEVQKQQEEAARKIEDAIADQLRIAQELALIAERREERRAVRQERRRREATTILENRKITKQGRTLVFGKNGQLYVFRKGQIGRSKMSSYYRRLQRILRGMREAAEQIQQSQGQGIQ
jgi:hypothetical protein